MLSNRYSNTIQQLENHDIEKDKICTVFLSHYFPTTCIIFALKSCITVVTIYCIKLSSQISCQCHSMLCASLPNPFCNTMQSMAASKICDDPCTDVGSAKVSTVGRYPQLSGEAYIGMISSISCSLVKSGDLISMQML